MSGVVQAPALATPESHPDTDENVLVPMTATDALSAAQSMRTLIGGRNPRVPRGTAEVFDRVSKSMASSARLAFMQSKVRK